MKVRVNDAPAPKKTTRKGCQSMYDIYPIGSMYGIYAKIWGILMVNVTISGIHGSYGYN